MTTINEIISKELTVADFTDAEILQMAYGIINADLDGHYWNVTARPLFLAKLNQLKTAKSPAAAYVSPAKIHCGVCGHEGEFTTIVGSGICDDCV